MQTADTSEPQQHLPLQEDRSNTGPLAPQAHMDDDDNFSSDLEVIFRREYARLDTIPLTPQSEPFSWRFAVLVLLMFGATITGAIIGLVTYPSVTITLVPVSNRVTDTDQLALATRLLAPVTVSQVVRAPTSGYGHQDAHRATGSLTLYNSLFSPQTVAVGTVFTAEDGVQVRTTTSATIPANNPPLDGQATVSAAALLAGRQGNIAEGDLHLVWHGLLVRNSAFTGGLDARDYRAVAQTDLDTLTAQARTQLAQQMPYAFALAAGEAVIPTRCLFRASPDHGVGEEAASVTVHASETCQGVAYQLDALAQQATAAFIRHTIPGLHYELLSGVETSVLSVSPFTVRITGTWVYILSPDYEQFLAQQIAGETPQQARSYLFRTGFVTRATVPATLPKDPGHIHFLILIGG